MAAASVAVLNRLERSEFVRVLGGIFEHSPWVAEQAFECRPFASLDALHAVMVAVVATAARDEQLTLIRAHPDLAGKAARAGTMTASSVAEQATAGLDRLTDDEYTRFERLNAAYREKFGFPFIIAVRRHDKHAILAAFEKRLDHGADEEIDEALRQIAEIARLRLGALVDA